MDLLNGCGRFKTSAPALATTLLLSLALGGCAPLFFHPARELAAPPDLAGGSLEEIFFPSGDGVRLHGWILRPPGPPKGTVLFYHGNAENMSTHVNAVLWLVKAGYLVFAFDYRGYGISDGTPDIPGVNRDGVAALDLAFHIRGGEEDGIVVFGQSLGGAIATYAVANSPRRGKVKALIVDSSFAGYRRIVRDKLIGGIVTLPLAWPASWTVEDAYSPERWIGSVAPVPVVVIQGTKDPVIPFSHGERLYRLAGEPKGFWKVEGGGHATALLLPDVRAQLLGFLDSVLFSPPRQESSVSPLTLNQGEGNLETLFQFHSTKEAEMKKLLVMLAALSLFPASYASANQMNTGCGVGTLIFQDTKDQSTLVQVVAMSTNGTFINTFGVTTGTSECKQPSKVVQNERMNEFVHANLDELARDISAGKGETLSTVAELMGVPSADRAAFNANLQANFHQIFPTPGVEYAHVVDTIISVSNQG